MSIPLLKSSGSVEISFSGVAGPEESEVVALSALIVIEK